MLAPLRAQSSDVGAGAGNRYTVRVLHRTLPAALALCALAVIAAAAEPSGQRAAPASHVDAGPVVPAADSKALSSHGLTVASTMKLPPIWLEALPPPPTTVTRQTKTYGTVTIDHVAHLARRVACKACHGPGPVKPIVFTPRVAHDRCRGCHTEIARGPTSCNGCHTVTKPDEALVKTEVVPVTTVAAVVPAAPSRAEVLAALVPDVPPPSFHRSVELGVTTLASGGDLLHGPTVHLVGHYGDDLLTYTLSIPGGATRGRTQFLVGGGRQFVLSRRTRWSALGVAGLDATYDPATVLPGLGLRLGVEVAAPWSAIRTVALQLTALTDVVGSDAAGRHAGDVSVGVTLVAGMPLSR